MNEKIKQSIELFKELVDAVKGRRNVKQRLSVLSDPENKDAMSVLSKGEAGLLSAANFLASSSNWGLMFKPLQSYAQSIRDPNVSIGGRGRDDVIRFMQAMNEAKAATKTGEKEETKNG